jgi:hypothetical protein
MTSRSLRSVAVAAALALTAGCRSDPGAGPITTTPTTTSATPSTTAAPSTTATPSTTAAPTTTATPTTTIDPIAGAAASITADQLMADVRILTATPRSTDAQRQNTRKWLQQQLEASGYEVQRWTRADTSLSPAVPVNLVARLPGTAKGPEQVLLVTAHYDSVANVAGADDNASGVAAVLAVARALAAAHPTLDATIEFVFFDLEELGLLGSQAYVAEGIGGRVIIGVINLESVGYTCGEGCQPVFTDIPGCLTVGGTVQAKGDNIVAVGDETSTDLMTTLTVAAQRVASDRAVGTGLVVGNGACMSVTRRSDHTPFWDAGIPALMVTDLAEYRNTNYHRPTDTADTLDAGYLLDVTRTVAATTILAAGPA